MCNSPHPTQCYNTTTQHYSSTTQYHNTTWWHHTTTLQHYSTGTPQAYNTVPQHSITPQHNTTRHNNTATTNEWSWAYQVFRCLKAARQMHQPFAAVRSRQNISFSFNLADLFDDVCVGDWKRDTRDTFVALPCFASPKKTSSSSLMPILRQCHYSWPNTLRQTHFFPMYIWWWSQEASVFVSSVSGCSFPFASIVSSILMHLHR